MRVDILKTPGKFVVQSIHVGDDASTNFDNRFFSGGYSLHIFIVFEQGILGDSVITVGKENVQELIQLRLSRSPSLDGHVSQCSGIVIEAGGYERKQHTNTTIRGICDPMKMIQNANRFATIGALYYGW
jgi:hypothetical protein